MVICGVNGWVRGGGVGEERGGVRSGAWLERIRGMVRLG